MLRTARSCLLPLIVASLLVAPRAAPAAPAAPTPVAVGEVTALHGEVAARAAKATSWSPAHAGPLELDGRLGTRAGASADVTLPGGAALHLRAETTILPRAGARPTVELEQGGLELHLADGAPLTLRTAAAELQLTGGDAVVAVDPVGLTWIANLGTAPLTVRARRGGAATGPTRTVAPGAGMRVERGRALEVAHPLPAAPTPAADADRAFLGLPGRPAPLVLSWPAVTGAARYHVALQPAVSAADRSGVTPELIDDVDLPPGVARFERAGLPPGRYQLALTSIDASGLPSAPAIVDLAVGALAIYPPGGDAPLTELPRDGADRPLVALGARLVGPGACALGPGERADEVRASTLGVAALTCTVFGQAAAPVTIAVTPVRMALTPIPPLPRGQPTTVRIVVSASAPLGDALEVGASGGLQLGDVTRTDDGLAVEVTALATAASATLVVSSGDVLLGEVALPLAAAGPLVESVPSREVDWFALELGGHLGVLALPSPGPGALGLGASSDLRHALSSGPAVGGGATLFPTRAVGLGGELAIVAAGYADALGTATVVAGRAHVVVRVVDDDRFGLRLLGGVSALGLASSAAGSHRGVDGALHWGAVFAARIDHRLWFDVEALHTVAPARDGGYASAVALQVGLFTRFGRAD